MLTAFVDESERNEDFYFLGALVCNEEQFHLINRGLDAILWKHVESSASPRISLANELHGHTLMQRIDDWKGVPMRLVGGIYLEALQVIADSGACVHIEGVDVAAQKARGYPTVTPARELAFSHLLERLNECATSKDEAVHLYADDHHSSEASRSQFASYRSFGTYGYKSSKLKRLHPEIRFIDSKRSRTLQAADLVTYLFNRDSTITETDERAEKLKRTMVNAMAPARVRGGCRIWP